MNCKNCGNPLSGIEHACPLCGAKLPEMPQPVPGQMMPGGQQMPGMPQQMMPGMPQQIPGMPQQMPGMPQQPMGPQMTPVGYGQQPMTMGVMPEQPAEEVKPPKDNKMLVILLAVVAIAAIGVGIFLLLTDEEEPTRSNNSSQEEYNEPVSNTINYGGYTINVPSGYTAEINDYYGLMIKGATAIFTIGVDYTNDYNFYKTAFLNAFPTEAANMVKTIGSTEYVAVIITDPEGANGTQYMASTLDEKGTFVGMVVRSDYTPPTEAEFNTLNEMITTAVLQNEVSPGDDDDYGKSGFKNFLSTYSKNQFTFN